MKTFKKVKSLTKPAGYSKAVAEKFSSKHLTKIINILETSFRSENSSDYGDDDYSFGPAMGAAANMAKEFNRELRVLIAISQKELHRIQTKEKSKKIQELGKVFRDLEGPSF